MVNCRNYTILVALGGVGLLAPRVLTPVAVLVAIALALTLAVLLWRRK